MDSTLDDRTLASDKAGHKEADIANTAIEIKHMHPAVDSGRDQHPLGRGLKQQFGLFDQALVYTPCATKRAIRVIPIEPSPFATTVEEHGAEASGPSF
jgi:hypothetical protein